MIEKRLYPRLPSDHASALKRKLLQDPRHATFDPALLDEVINDSGAFPPTGGRRMTMGDLLTLREDCQQSLPSETNQWSSSAFDLQMGRTLYETSTGSPGEFGNAKVWDFLTLVLLPDLALTRFPKEARGATARLTGGNRRHVFQRLWRRWQVFGPAIVESNLLTEDDYVAILERSLTSQKKEVARRTVTAIRLSGRTGSARREYTRMFTRQLIQASGIVDISSDDPAHLDGLFKRLGATTNEILDSGPTNN